jgi:aspartate carbamoyltransferase catalytic subunit
MVCGLSTKLEERKRVDARRHLLSAEQLTRADIEHFMAAADEMRNSDRMEVLKRHRGKVVATLFYEPSTRTRLSFESAAVRLGAHVVSAENAMEHSSAKKGETLEDVFRVVGCYADAIVIRHHEAQAMHTAAKLSPVPVLNAGAGAGEHPTQALLDVYTLRRELKRLDGLKLCVVGDLKYGRTVHSLLRLLTQFEDVEVSLLAPPSLQLPESMQSDLTSNGLTLRRGSDFESEFPQVDAVYQTRIQTERLTSQDESRESATFALGLHHLQMLPAHACIMHPLPRVTELDPQIDCDPRAAYFRQVENGLYMRMAILDAYLRGDEE